ncbi:MAG: transglutaminase domain-containing protein [Burkholderiales bacterium]|jgi:hypothetical protein|nr:transglutaminase domain-containing protein [Burkholderiales bacterium]
MNFILNRRFFLRQCVISASCTHWVSPCFSLSNETSFSNEEKRVLRKLRFALWFHNPLPIRLSEQQFLCYLPLESESQKLLNIEVSMPYKVEEDTLGHNLLRLVFNEVPGFFQKVVTLNITIECIKKVAKLTSFFPADWLQPERFIESNASQVVKLASELKREFQLETAKSIFDWVTHNISYSGYIAEDLGALYALENRRGDCTEYAYLVVALARANHIPARMVGGYVTDSNTIAPKPQDYHDWAEISLEGQWHIIDAQKRNFFPSRNQYIAFRIHHDLPNNKIGTAHRYRVDGRLQVIY